jgi:polar amino acid transport system substrate-binding protein
MRKTLTAVSILALGAVALTAAGGVGAARHAAAGTSFKYCDNPTFPPMENSTKGGKPTGFDIDFATALGKQLGGKATYVFSSFSGFPYMHSHRALIVAGGNPKHITSPNGLKGMSVAVQAATKYEVYLKALQKKIGFTLRSYPGDSDAIGQILIGRADAVLSQDTSAAYAQGQHPGKVAIGYLFPNTDAFGVYYRRGEPIGSQIKAAIATLKKNGTLAKLAVKYHIPVGDVK